MSTTTATTLTHREAFLKGWQASARTTTYDLDAAEARFEARHGRSTGTAFAAGWTAYATGEHDAPGTAWTDVYAAQFTPAPVPVTPAPVTPERRAAKNRSNAASALRTVSPADVEATADLWQSDPAMSLRLRDAVIAACAKPSRDVDMAAVAGLAVLSVARHYRRATSPAHAVALAVMSARTSVVLATLAEAETTVSADRDDIRTRLLHWTAPADRVGQVDSLRSLMADALDVLPADDRETFGRIVTAWVGHVPAACDACQTPGARPNRLTLSSIRAHVAGMPSSDSRAKRLRESDARIVTAATEALRPLVESGEYADGTVWPLVFGDAWHAVNGSGARRTAGNVDPATVRRVRHVETVVDAPGRSRAMSAPAAIPGERVAAVMARRDMAARVAEAERVARIRRAQDRDAGRGADGERVPVLPMWTGGPYAGPAAAPADPATSGRYVGDVHPVAGTVRRIVGQTVRDVAPLPVVPSLPDVDAVTVRRADGTTVVRAMTDAERAAGHRAPETVDVAGQTVPVVAATYAGEDDRRDGRRGGTAPAPAGDRVGGKSDGQVRAFPASPSPRKRPGGNTGPTIPVRLR